MAGAVTNYGRASFGGTGALSARGRMLWHVATAALGLGRAAPELTELELEK